jgi:hypothetical protein
MIPVTSADISETVVHVDTMVYNPDLPTRADITETVVHGSDMTVKSAAVKSVILFGLAYFAPNSRESRGSSSFDAYWR